MTSKAWEVGCRTERNWTVTFPSSSYSSSRKVQKLHRSHTGYRTQSGMVMGNKWGVHASYCLSIKSEVDLNISHQVQFSKSTFHLQSIQNIPFKYHQQVSQLWSKGHSPDRPHCALLNTIRSQHSQLLAPDWAGNLLLQLIPVNSFFKSRKIFTGKVNM